MRTARWLLALMAVVAALSFSVVAADARMGGSFGSRGGRTFSAPAITNTAPRTAAPIQNTITPRGATQSGGGFFGQPSRPGGLFGGGLFGGLATGFLTAGLFGLLFGHGFFGGMVGFASFLGFIIQIVLVVIVARLVWSWFSNRGPATAGGPSLRQGLNGGGGGSTGFGFGGFGGGGGSAAPAGEPIEVSPADFDAFEKLLGEIQTAYGREDLGTLRARMTPEMLSYFADELSRNASRGVVNKVSDVKLLQGDLSEAWREGADEYATVAMRYSLNDTFVERASGRVVEQEPSEITELWTFRRVRGGGWLLSAIQQS